ncbi:MAG: MBL fold metallo-hydrolase [Candidatus Aenigmatarchaeota archaeon]|nr:MBL fold metallo-hydrolase [Candidatus Aenigmarchaeota archaeon]RLJ05070.1 MAG: MBL fold metallo-hydrolase [Candidatus Aenigmarchaeota archaeon]
MQVHKNIFLFDGVGYDSNIYLIDGEVLVDTGTGAFFSETKDEIMKLGFGPRKIKLIVNTHCHFDHTGADKKFRDWTKAKIAIHKKDKAWLESGRNTLAESFNEQARSITVDQVLERGSKIKTKNFTFEVIHTPGHTPGSICLYEKNHGILISGDTIFSDGIGRTDYPGGSKRDLLFSIKKLTRLKVKTLLPGHGMPKIGGASLLIKQIYAIQ